MSHQDHPILYWVEIAFGVAGCVFGLIACYRQWRRPHAPKQFADGVLMPMVFSLLLFGMTGVITRLAIPRELRSNFDVFAIWGNSLLFSAFVVVWCASVWKNRR